MHDRLSIHILVVIADSSGYSTLYYCYASIVSIIGNMFGRLSYELSARHQLKLSQSGQRMHRR